MRNPLMKRIPRELKHDIGKYLAIFVFMVLFIGLISGFLVADTGFEQVYNRNFEESKIEDGHVSFNMELPDEVRKTLEEQGDLSIYEDFYFEEDVKDTEKTLRVYSTERALNFFCLMSGELPINPDEIAIDRMFAQNNEIKVGDTLVLKDTELTVTGLVAFSDYSSLYEKNADMMFDAMNFCVAVLSPEGFEAFETDYFTYNYAWLYPEFIERTNESAAKERSDSFIELLKNVITEYDEIRAEEIMQEYMEIAMTSSNLSAEKRLEELDNELLTIKDYLPRYLNKAINFVGEDMGSDKVMFVAFDYILTVVLAFVFAITVSNTITTEAGVIGTLRASGYTKGEILSHYIILPVFVTLVAAVLGNILGYTLFCDLFINMYYENYSLPLYEELWSWEAFLLTTVVPLAIMLMINLFVIITKLRFSPLKFLRHDLNRHGRKKGLHLSEKIPFFSRFRIRIILQNLPNYLTLFFGIFLGGVLVVFGIMFLPLLEDYKELIVNDRICDYQYILMEEAETADENAEKYSLTSLRTTDSRYLEDEISVFGVEVGSKYIDAAVEDGKIVVSDTIIKKFGLSIGDTLTLKDPYDDAQCYNFIIDETMNYSSGMAVFMSKTDYADLFDTKVDAFDGYFSNTKLTDLDERAVVTVITTTDLTKMTDQLNHSFGSFMGIFQWLGIVIFILLMFILSKQIIEKNANAISMTKILGFKNAEIGGLYIVATSIVVVLSLILSIPLLNAALKILFATFIYTKMTGYIPFMIHPMCYVEMVVLGMISYLIVAVVQMYKINKIPKSNALKKME